MSLTKATHSIITPPDGYLKAAATLCKKHNILFIIDEVQTGFGRTGTDLCYQHEPDVKPDLVCLGKSLTGGIPVIHLFQLSLPIFNSHYLMTYRSWTAVSGNGQGRSYVTNWKIRVRTLRLPTSHLKPTNSPPRNRIVSTFAAAPYTCAAALAAIDVFESENLSSKAQARGKLLYDTLADLNPPHVLEYRGKGRGMYQCMVIDESVPGVTGRRVQALCAQKGLLIGNSANRIRFSPPLVIGEEDVLKGARIVDQVLREVAEAGEFPGCEFLW